MLSCHVLSCPSRVVVFQAFVRWSAAADDGGGALTKYVVIASTSYSDINVEAITAVTHTVATEAGGDGDGGDGDGEDGGGSGTTACRSLYVRLRQWFRRAI